MPFADNLKRLRELAGLSQKELAEKAGLDNTQISRLENKDVQANPTLFTIVILANALNCNPNDLLQNILASENKVKEGQTLYETKISQIVRLLHKYPSMQDPILQMLQNYNHSKK